MRVLTQFLLSALDPLHFPPSSLPEVAFLGRSNVGKSSVINSLVGSKIARSSFIEPYLKERESLALCLSLVDISVPQQESDRRLLDFLRTEQRPFIIVATKSDRLSNNQLQNALRKLGQEYPDTKIVSYSARTGTGRQELWQEIRQTVNLAVGNQA